jgi:hypothetical protein
LSLAAFLTTVVGALRDADIPFMLTGSLAAAYHGAPRATQDLDLVIDADAGELELLLDALATAGLYVSREAAREAYADSGQFNAIDPVSGWKADLIIRRTRAFSKTEFGRRLPVELFGIEVALATVEDLIIVKLEWSELGDSELQRSDVRLLLEAAGDSLDEEYIRKWIDVLGLHTAWQRIQEQR